MSRKKRQVHIDTAINNKDKKRQMHFTLKFQISGKV